MQTIQGLAEELLKAIEQIIPSVASTEKYTAVETCVVALHHADLAVSQGRDYERACKCVFALQPFRTLAERVSRGQAVDLINAGYTCAVLLKKTKIDEARYIDEIIARLGLQLPSEKKSGVDKWATERVEELNTYGPGKDQDPWAVVRVMINTVGGIGYKAALATVAERAFESRKAVEQWNQYLQQRKEEGNKLVGKTLPFGGSIVVGPDSASVHFGLGGGSVTVVDGKLSVMLPHKS